MIFGCALVVAAVTPVDAADKADMSVGAVNRKKYAMADVDVVELVEWRESFFSIFYLAEAVQFREEGF